MVGNDGVIRPVAGGGSCVDCNGVPATQAKIDWANGIAIDRAGRLDVIGYSGTGPRIWQVGTEGTLSRLAGADSLLADPSGWPTTAVATGFRERVAIDNQGAPILPTYYGAVYGMHKVRPALPAFSASELALVDGTKLHRFSEDGRHLSTTSTNTSATLYSFSYDTSGRITKITDADGNATTIQRDASGKPTAIVAPFGQTTTLALDTNGYLSSVTNPAGEATVLVHRADGLLSSLTDPRGKTHQFDYDSLGRLAKDADPASGETLLSRSEEKTTKFTVSSTSGEGRTTSYNYEATSWGDRYMLNTFPGELQSNAQLRNDGTSQVSYADGTATTRQESPDPRWAMQAALPKSTSVTTPSGLKLTTAFTRSVVLSNPQDLMSLTSQTDTFSMNGRTSTTVYSASAKQYTTTSPAGRVTQVSVDAQERVLAYAAPGLAPVSYVYDAKGRLQTVTQGSAPNARITATTYDANGWIASITDPLNQITSFPEYDLAGRLKHEVLPINRDILFSYDANGNLTSMTPPSRPAHLFAYTPVNLMDSYTPPDVGFGSTTTSYQYNKDRQLTQVTRPDGLTIVYGYDTAGRLSTITTPTGVKTYVYNPTTGKLDSVSAPGGVGLSYTWDGFLLKDTTWSGPVAGMVSRGYNADFDVASLTVAGSSVSFSRDNDRLLTGAGALTITRDPASGFITGTTLDAISTSRGYSTFGELASTSASTGSTPLYSTSYTRDALGRITQLDETVQGTSSSTVYEYDTAGRLWRVTVDGALAAENTYDANGNRTAVTNSELGTSTTATHDAQDRLLTFGSTSYTYSKAGELQTKTGASGTTTYGYDVLGNLRSVALPDGRSIEHVIDGEGHRVGKKVNGALVQGWLYAGRRLVAELDGGGAVVSTFVYGSRPRIPDYMVRGGNTYRILSDHLGSPRLVVDATTGAVVQRMDFDEWGNVTQDTNPGFQPFGFAAGLYDRDTKLVRFGARDYDAEAGRWMSKDPYVIWGRALNAYAYVQNDPVNRIDPTGFDDGSTTISNGIDPETGDPLEFGENGVGGAPGGPEDPFGGRRPDWGDACSPDPLLPWGKKPPPLPDIKECKKCKDWWDRCVFDYCRASSGPPPPGPPPPPTDRGSCIQWCGDVYETCKKNHGCL